MENRILNKLNHKEFVNADALSDKALYENGVLTVNYLEGLINTAYDLLAGDIVDNELPHNFIYLVSEGMDRIADLKKILDEMNNRIKTQE